MRTVVRLILTAVIATAPIPAVAGAPKPAALGTIEHMPAELTVVGVDGSERRYNPAELEKMPTYSLRTTTPWRSEPAEFEGVLLTDILAANGLSDAAAINVSAENDYTITIPRAAWEELQILVATRVDGKPHTRRDRGPIQFVIDAETYAASALAREDYLVWMASRIEAVR